MLDEIVLVTEYSTALRTQDAAAAHDVLGLGRVHVPQLPAILQSTNDAR